MKKRYVIVLVILVVLLLAAGTACWSHVSAVRSFDLADYAQFMEAFPDERVVQPIASAGDAKSAAEAVWLEVYGDTVLDEKPYRIFRDENNDAWFVTGSVPFHHNGGAACILLKDDGQVLAVWHEK